MKYGAFEDQELQVLPDEAIRGLLNANGYKVHYNLYCGEHEFISWQGEIANGLIYFFENS